MSDMGMGFGDQYYDPEDPMGWQQIAAALQQQQDPLGMGFSQYTRAPSQQDAMLQYLLSLDKPGLTQMRSALTGVGTDLSNQGKILSNQNKMLDTQGDMMKLAMNPMVGQMSGAFDPMAMQMQGQPGQMGGDPNAMVPFGATEYSPLRAQWETSQTPASQAVLAMFDQIDQGQDPSTLVTQFAAANGGSLDVPDKATGLTGQQLLSYGQSYWNEATKRRQAQAAFQYKQANTPMPGMEGVDPTLGSFTEPFVQPSIGETLVGNEMARQDENTAQREAMMRSLAGTNVVGGTNIKLDQPAFTSQAEMPNLWGQTLNSLKQGSDWVNKKIGGTAPDDQSLFFPSNREPDIKRVGGKKQSVGQAVSSFVSNSNRKVGVRPKPKPKVAQPSPEDRQKSASHVTNRLTALEDKERSRLGLKSRDSGESVGSHNLRARLSYLSGAPLAG